MIGYVFIFIALCAALGLYKLRRTMARHHEYLAGSAALTPLALEHLGAALQRFARETRSLRLSLDAAIRDVADLREHPRGTEDLQSLDAMLLNVSRDIADWLSGFDQLVESDQRLMVDQGAHPEAIRRAFHDEGFSFDRIHMQRPGRPPLDERLGAIRHMLHTIETVLQNAPQLYR